MRFYSLCMGINLLLCSQLLFAQSCNNAVTQLDINQCTEAEFKTADRRLNQVYHEIQKNQDQEQKKQLILAQKAWLQYRDLDCHYQAEAFRGGSIYPTVYVGCLLEKTHHRIHELQSRPGQKPPSDY